LHHFKYFSKRCGLFFQAEATQALSQKKQALPGWHAQRSNKLLYNYLNDCNNGQKTFYSTCRHSFRWRKPGGSSALLAAETRKNKLPRWRGFNLTDFNTPNPSPNRKYTTEEHLKWMRDWGFNFVRPAYGVSLLPQLRPQQKHNAR
jgi:aryl-phospho-beta-D-glucosidase BglC (GH1 family)